MERECLRCHIQMKKAQIKSDVTLTLEEMKKEFSAKSCTVNTYVCPKCGYIEFAAKKPEIFG